VGRRPSKELDAGALEEWLKRTLRLDHVRVLTVRGEVYRKHKMGYAVGVARRVVKGVETEERVPVLVRFNPDGSYVHSVVPLELEVLDPLWDLVKEARRVAIKLSTTPSP